MGIIIPPDEIDRYYVNVLSLQTITRDYVLPNGKTLYLRELTLNASGDLTCVKLIFDPDGSNEILASTSGDTNQDIVKNIVGDGIKKLRLELRNNSLETKTLGGYYLGMVQ